MSLSKDRLEKIEEFEKSIGYSFNDKALIDVTFTHSSFTNEARIRQNPMRDWSFG